VCVTTGPVVLEEPSSKSQSQLTISKPLATVEAEASKVISSPGQAKCGTGSPLLTIANGRSHGYPQLISAPKLPAPLASEVNCTVKHPEVLPGLADTSSPCSSYNSKVPSTVAEVVVPS